MLHSLNSIAVLGLAAALFVPAAAAQPQASSQPSAAAAPSPTAKPARPGPLSPAESGMLECVKPNEALKQCVAVTKYVRNEDGSWKAHSFMALPGDFAVVMEIEGHVEVVGDRVCSLVTRESFRQAKFYIEQKPVPAQARTAIISNLLKSPKIPYGKTVCELHRQTPDGIMVHPEDEGEATPDYRLSWFQPGAGYSVVWMED